MTGSRIRRAIAAICLAAVFYLILTSRIEARLEMLVFDVGQGDAILLDDGHGNQILVDGGPDDGILSRLGQTLPWHDRRIEVVVVTHPDADHLSGLLAVLDRYAVDTILEYIPEPPETGLFLAWRERVVAEGSVVLTAESGMQLQTGNGFSLDVFVPDPPLSAENDNSIMLSLRRDGHCLALLTGDAGVAEERGWLVSGQAKACEVLKIGHHGSKTSTSVELLQLLQPERGVISVGADNRYGHPHPDVLARLSGLSLHRTDQQGTFRISW